MSEEHKEQLARIGQSLKELETDEVAQVVAYAEGAAAIATARAKKDEEKTA